MRRHLLLVGLGLPWAAGAEAAQAAAAQAPRVERRALAFPRDHGAHPAFRIEWWYVTGWLEGSSRRLPCGFQLTFFRSRVRADEGDAPPGRFEPRQLLLAHAAVSDLGGRGLLHGQRLARWNGDPAAAAASAALDDTQVQLHGWRFTRTPLAGGGARYDAVLDDRDAGFGYELACTTTQPVLLQGDAGFSRKGPDEAQSSHYYSQPQLAVEGRLRLAGERLAVRGRAWLDHEWSETLLHPEALGWDWIGMNLDDGSALTAFRLRRRDGTALWAGGSLRRPGGNTRAFGPDEVRFTPGRTWQSPASRARYPVAWTLETPAGRHQVLALLDAQELNGRASTGTIYWEGLSELLDAAGRRVGMGYLEMTGYASPLRLG